MSERAKVNILNELLSAPADIKMIRKSKNFQIMFYHTSYLNRFFYGNV